ncbi:MAG: ubiquinol-cytochrome c reductase iron-sulfur subunit [Alphaproteobacteria bacterium]|nr:MAG: ubiquinol-cytochrome c reductase iron-sulfur subunit [Alphaproteobacteria bacterium]
MTAGGAPQETEGTRRDFLYIGTAVFAAAGIGRGVVWPLIDQLNPADNVKALASIEVDLSKVAVGSQMKVLWRGKAVFIRHRTEADIAEARAVPLDDLPDPATDESRAERPEWLIMLGVCTHLGCVPIADRGEYDGWFCPCHGSHYDTAGRIRKGPAPRNLDIPPYAFLNDTTIKIG